MNQNVGSAAALGASADLADSRPWGWFHKKMSSRIPITHLRTSLYTFLSSSTCKFFPIWTVDPFRVRCVHEFFQRPPKMRVFSRIHQGIKMYVYSVTMKVISCPLDNSTKELSFQTIRTADSIGDCIEHDWFMNVEWNGNFSDVVMIKLNFVWEVSSAYERFLGLWMSAQIFQFCCFYILRNWLKSIMDPSTTCS